MHGIGTEILDLGKSLKAAAEPGAAMPPQTKAEEAGFLLPAVEDPAAFCKANFGVGYGIDR